MALMAEQVFFYGTLRTGFNRTTRAGIDTFLKFAGRATLTDAEVATLKARSARLFGGEVRGKTEHKA